MCTSMESNKSFRERYFRNFKDNSYLRNNTGEIAKVTRKAINGEKKKKRREKYDRILI